MRGKENGHTCDVVRQNETAQGHAVRANIFYWARGLLSIDSTRSIRGPSTAPGQIAFTLTLADPNSIASVFINPISPHFAAT